MADDLDLQELLNRIKIGLIFILVVVGAFLVFIYKKFGAENSNVLDKLSKNDNINILVVENKCSKCSEIKKALNSEKVDYIVLNIDKDKYYNTILKKLEITKNDIKVPSLIYVKDKKVYSILVDINEEELKGFIDNYNLSNKVE